MKNKLIIITSTIGRMGGAQMYVENKVNYFQSKGWEVYVFYFLYAENILLSGLEKFRNNYIPDLQYPIQYVPNYRRRKIISQIKEKVQPADSFVVIESQLTSSAYWAELMAAELKARHVINIIEEQIPVFLEKENEFFDFKLTHGDIMNASSARLHTMFKDRFKEEYSQYVRIIKVPCANVVASDVDVDYKFENSDYTILSIGRLDKPYIPTMNEEVKKFAAGIGEKTINLIYIGGSRDGSMEVEVPKQFDGIGNIRCYVLGYVYPIPQNLIKKADVSIACANSVLVSANEGVPTIVVDVDDYSAIGVYGCTTKNLFRRRAGEKMETISSLLNQILVARSFDGLKAAQQNVANADAAFEDDMAYYLDGKNADYYDIDSIYSMRTKCISRSKYIIRRSLDFFHK